jgi:hypothetical protein
MNIVEFKLSTLNMLQNHTKQNKMLHCKPMENKPKRFTLLQSDNSPSLFEFLFTLLLTDLYRSVWVGTASSAAAAATIGIVIVVGTPLETVIEETIGIVVDETTGIVVVTVVGRMTVATEVSTEVATEVVVDVKVVGGLIIGNDGAVDVDVDTEMYSVTVTVVVAV